MSKLNNLPENLYHQERPKAFLLCAFTGWNDAGDAAVDAIDYLNRAYDAAPLPSFDVSTYYNYTQARPQLSHVGNTPVLEWPGLTAHTFQTDGKTYITLTGPEPHHNWQDFSQKLFDFARQQEAEHLILLGALLGENPHTRPFPISITSYTAAHQAAGIPLQSYTGPTGIVGVLAATAQGQGLTDLSLWASIPHYTGHPPQPKASYELLKQLRQLLHLPLDLRTLEEEKEAWERGAEELLAEEPELASYVQELEKHSEENDIDGDDIAQAFQQYLKGRDQ